MNAVYLTTPGRFGTPLRSDTLWGMIVAAIGQVRGEQALLHVIEAAERGTPLFRISSAMPFSEDAEGIRLHYFPRPLQAPYAPEVADQQMMRRLKEFKKWHWLTQDVFEQVINGEVDEQRLFEQYLSGVAAKPSMRSVYSEHIAIDRLRGTTMDGEGHGQLFTREQYTAPEGGGLFFLIEGETELALEALRFLEHFGFGADNTVGSGHFHVEIAPFDLRQPDEANRVVHLALYCPSSDELKAITAEKEHCWYELEIRRGRVGSHFVHARDVRKEPMPMFREGSSFPLTGGLPKGCVRTVKEIGDLRIRHSGLAFPVAAHWSH